MPATRSTVALFCSSQAAWPSPPRRACRRWALPHLLIPPIGTIDIVAAWDSSKNPEV
jgi:hypothetical protein